MPAWPRNVDNQESILRMACSAVTRPLRLTVTCSSHLAVLLHGERGRPPVCGIFFQRQCEAGSMCRNQVVSSRERGADRNAVVQCSWDIAVL